MCIDSISRADALDAITPHYAGTSAGTQLGTFPIKSKGHVITLNHTIVKFDSNGGTTLGCKWLILLKWVKKLK